MQTDWELVRRLRAGDDQAFQQLVDQFSNLLFGLAFSLAGNAADAEDIVQETLLGAFRGISRFRGDSTLKTWLTRILVRQAAKSHRSSRVRKSMSIERVSDSARAVLESRESESAVNATDLRMDVLSILATLSPDHREVIALRELQGMSYEEMAEVLDVPPGTVESRLFRARQELRERLKGYLT